LEDNADGEDHEDDDEDSEDDVEINGPGVFGKYRDSYYAGRIIKRVGNLYQIEFADADTEDLAIGNIRQGILRSGDKVKSNVRGQSQKAIYVVKHDWSYDTTYSEAERDTLITVTHEKTGAERTIPLRHLHIAYRTVLSAWDDRHVDAADFAHLPWSDGTRDRPAATATARPAPKTAIKFVQGTNAFAGQAFMITPRGEDTKRYETLIIRHGGTVCEWQDLFVDASSPNGLNGTSAPKITFGDGLKTAQTPYLITTSSIGGEFEEPKKGEQQGKMKAKIMCALSFGIPCLAPVYIEEALRDVSAASFGTIEAVPTADKIASARYSRVSACARQIAQAWCSDEPSGGCCLGQRRMGCKEGTARAASAKGEGGTVCRAQESGSSCKFRGLSIGSMFSAWCKELTCKGHCHCLFDRPWSRLAQSD
jgi:hypothetical protein